MSPKLLPGILLYALVAARLLAAAEDRGEAFRAVMIDPQGHATIAIRMRVQEFPQALSAEEVRTKYAGDTPKTNPLLAYVALDEAIKREDLPAISGFYTAESQGLVATRFKDLAALAAQRKEGKLTFAQFATVDQYYFVETIAAYRNLVIPWVEVFKKTADGPKVTGDITVSHYAIKAFSAYGSEESQRFSAQLPGNREPDALRAVRVAVLPGSGEVALSDAGRLKPAERSADLEVGFRIEPTSPPVQAQGYAGDDPQLLFLGKAIGVYEKKYQPDIAALWIKEGDGDRAVLTAAGIDVRDRDSQYYWHALAQGSTWVHGRIRTTAGSVLLLGTQQEVKEYCFMREDATGLHLSRTAAGEGFGALHLFLMERETKRAIKLALGLPGK